MNKKIFLLGWCLLSPYCYSQAVIFRCENSYVLNASDEDLRTGKCKLISGDVNTPKPAKQAQNLLKARKADPTIAVNSTLDTPQVVKFSMTMLEGDHVDPGYAGIPIAKIIDAIEKMTASKKGEFESTADYNARKAVVLARKILGDSSLTDTFAFVFPVSTHVRRTGFGYDFNADISEVRLFTLPLTPRMNGIGARDNQFESNIRMGDDLDQFLLESKIDSSRMYEGGNAYGARVTIEKINSTHYGIAANRIPFLSFKREKIIYSNPKPAVRFNMENIRAAKEIPALKALVVMKIMDPFIVYHFKSSKPTLDNPYELLDQSKYLTGNVLGIIFYSGLTGEIFARLPSSFGKPEMVEEKNQSLNQ